MFEKGASDRNSPTGSGEPGNEATNDTNVYGLGTRLGQVTFYICVFITAAHCPLIAWLRGFFLPASGGKFEEPCGRKSLCSFWPS